MGRSSKLHCRLPELRTRRQPPAPLRSVEGWRLSRVPKGGKEAPLPPASTRWDLKTFQMRAGTGGPSCGNTTSTSSEEWLFLVTWSQLKHHLLGVPKVLRAYHRTSFLPSTNHHPELSFLIYLSLLLPTENTSTICD